MLWSMFLNVPKRLRERIIKQTIHTRGTKLISFMLENNNVAEHESKRERRKDGTARENRKRKGYGTMSEGKLEDRNNGRFH